MEAYPHQSSAKTKSNPKSDQAGRFKHTENGLVGYNHRVKVFNLNEADFCLYSQVSYKYSPVGEQKWIK